MKKYNRYSGTNQRPQGFVPVIVVLSCVMMLLGVSAFFRITDVTVTGSEYYSAEEVKEASGVKIGSSLVVLNSSRISARIQESLMFAKEVRIIRHYPGTLELHVTVSMPAAYIRQNLDFWTMDSDGRVLEKKAQADVNGLVAVRGITNPVLESGKLVSSENDETDYAGIIAKVLLSLNAGKYSFHADWLDITDLGNIQIGTDSYTISFGSMENIVGKLALANAIVLEQADGSRGTIDVSTGETGHFIPNR